MGLANHPAFKDRIGVNNRIPYFLDWNARVLLVSSELLAGVVFEGAFYSRARSIPLSLSVTKFFSKHKKPWTISLPILIHHKQNYFIQHTNVRFILRKLLQHHRHW